jgi:hypothetical protein
MVVSPAGASVTNSKAGDNVCAFPTAQPMEIRMNGNSDLSCGARFHIVTSCALRAFLFRLESPVTFHDPHQPNRLSWSERRFAFS